MRQIVILFVQVMVLGILASGCAWAASGKKERLAKVDDALAVVSDEYFAYLAQGGAAGFTPSNSLLRVSEGRVAIDAIASADVHALKADLEALGMQGAVAFGRIVSGQLPIAAINALTALASLQFARPAYATTNVGPLSPAGPHVPTSNSPIKEGR
jgi:hypothetical protein